MLCVGTVIKLGLTVPGGTVPAGATELAAGRQKIDHIVPGFYFCSKEFCCFRTGGKTDGFASGIDTQNHGLLIAGASVTELDSKWGSLFDGSFPFFKKASCFRG
jgi:hypothetical protein